ncbi:MAG: hypothetical protein ABH882_04285 [Candidatus Omnitrophota bacterium]|nr:hypothetical protein [Candidatus Omnitrophota bacterium]MBU1928332.1 hypothetical protein [Candidatus Omnitrophota bacterium]MBU2034352.1 hypothetical protein [Candidatus Omnitrophota bacterium]MBU2222334.1 hypothetical protein [Candidatus Omnitrophota bacterium]MBU2258794.1 hypothetical protein [Candidatus Omnitrophota bacterium]
MKYLNVVLTTIVIFLTAIALRLVQISVLVENANESNQLFINSQQSLISSNQRLESALVDLRKQVEALSDKVVKK